MRVCMNCRYFDGEVEDMGVDKGICKRMPPTANYDSDSDMVVACQPAVDWTDWCGEWRES